MNAPVSFELAKLLKEKGFDKVCKKYYPDDGSLLISNKGSIRHIAYRIQAPTIAEVVMWLYEKYGIWICVATIPFEKHFTFEYSIHNISECLTQDGVFDSPTEAYEAAIEYVLNNLYEKL